MANQYGSGGMPGQQNIKRHIKHNNPVRSPAEDSLSQHQINLLLNAGYDYRNGAWRPGQPAHNANDKLSALRSRRLGR